MNGPISAMNGQFAAAGGYLHGSFPFMTVFCPLPGAKGPPVR